MKAEMYNAMVCTGLAFCVMIGLLMLEEIPSCTVLSICQPAFFGTLHAHELIQPRKAPQFKKCFAFFCESSMFTMHLGKMLQVANMWHTVAEHLCQIFQMGACVFFHDSLWDFQWRTTICWNPYLDTYPNKFRHYFPQFGLCAHQYRFQVPGLEQRFPSSLRLQQGPKDKRPGDQLNEQAPGSARQDACGAQDAAAPEFEQVFTRCTQSQWM